MGSPSPPPPPPPPKWVILRRDPQVCRDLSDDFSLTLGKPPNLTELAVSRHLAPDGVSVDCFPLIHAADPSGILLVSATYGRRSMGPPSADDDDKQAGNHTTNYFVWNAATDDTHRLPPHAESVKHTGNVGLVVAPRGDDEYNFMVAELLPPAGDRATLLCYWSYGREWVKKMVPFPLNLKFPWSGARTFSYQGKLWWLDLWQGLLNCDPFAKEPELLFVPLPDDTHTDTGDRDVSNHRCVNLSNGGLWLAEMTYHRHVLFVKMWKLGAQGQWTPDYTVKLADIWVDRSYEETGLPKKKPALVGINPDDPEVLYFLLGGNLLQVNMCAKRVELCVDFSPTTNLKIGQGSSQSQFILTWNLPTSIVSSSGQNQEERSSRDSAFDTIVDSFTNACASVPDHMEFSQLAMTAIEYLNQSRKEEKVKFRLSECLCLCYFDEEEASTSHRKQYIHMNFYVRTESERLPQLVFAEFVEANRNDDELCSWDLLSCKSINKNSPGGLYNTNADVGQKRKRSLHCYACEGQMKHPSSGFSAGCRADASKLVTDAEPLGAEPARESETEEGSAYDAGAEFTGLQLLHLTPDEQISRWRRLYKKRANMSLVFYHKSHSDRYEFAHVRLNDIFDFIEGKVAYLHMNFKARNVTTGSEQIFFSELMAEMDSNDDASNGYYRVSACEIVDGNCSGGRKQEVDCKYIPGNKHDMDNCYVCAEKIKHPVGSTYKGGHSVSDYGVEEISTE